MTSPPQPASSASPFAMAAVNGCRRRPLAVWKTPAPAPRPPGGTHAPVSTPTDAAAAQPLGRPSLPAASGSLLALQGAPRASAMSAAARAAAAAETVTRRPPPVVKSGAPPTVGSGTEARAAAGATASAAAGGCAGAAASVASGASGAGGAAWETGAVRDPTPGAWGGCWGGVVVSSSLPRQTRVRACASADVDAAARLRGARESEASPCGRRGGGVCPPPTSGARVCAAAPRRSAESGGLLLPPSGPKDVAPLSPPSPLASRRRAAARAAAAAVMRTPRPLPVVKRVGLAGHVPVTSGPLGTAGKGV